MGNLGTIQLIPLIPETMKELKDEKILFHVIGMGPMTDYLKKKKKIVEYHLEDVLIYHGPMPANMASSYIKGADAIFCLFKR